MKLSLLFCASLAIAQQREVAITIDDVPRGGDRPGATDTVEMTLKLTAALKNIPVTVFVNPGQARRFGEDGVAEIIKIWRKQGAEIGNHTFSHPDLNKIPLAEFEADVIRAQPALGKVRYFRHPFLHTGPTEEVKAALSKFLDEQGYSTAPVTIDTSDWLFASKNAPHAAYLSYMDGITAFFEKRAQEVLGRDIPQILLIHANRLNADTMPQLLAMFKKRGYRFISLEQALKDPVYTLPDGPASRNGISWIHRWAAAKGMKPSFEPEVVLP